MTILRRFLPLSFLITCLSGLIFLVIQQNIRMNANDPQIQLVEDTVMQLSTEDDTFQITSLPRVNIKSSLAPFVVIFDANGRPVSSSGEFNGELPILPSGVFAYAKEHEDNRFTWQPQKGVRIAAIVKHFTGRTNGYVLAGRSLREVERREDILLQQVLVGWIATTVITFIAILVTTSDKKRKK